MEGKGRFSGSRVFAYFGVDGLASNHDNFKI